MGGTTVAEGIKVEFGSGTVPRPGYFHIDLLAGEGIDYQGDALDWLATVNSGSIEEIYASHFLEHLDRPEVETFLAECHRVLMVNSRCEFHVPDLEAISLMVLGEKNLARIWENMPAIFGQAKRDGWHRCGFTPALLSWLLKRAGFKEIRRLLPGTCPWCVHDGKWYNLGMEAVK